MGLEEDGGANERGRRRGRWQVGEKRWRLRTARPLKGRCGWQLLTLVTMGFHQRLLMKADCQGIVREPRGEEERARERLKGEKGEREREKDRGEVQVIAALVGLRPCGPVMSGCSGEEERCLWTLWW